MKSCKLQAVLIFLWLSLFGRTV